MFTHKHSLVSCLGVTLLFVGCMRSFSVFAKVYPGDSTCEGACVDGQVCKKNPSFDYYQCYKNLCGNLAANSSSDMLKLLSGGFYAGEALYEASQNDSELCRSPGSAVNPTSVVEAGVTVSRTCSNTDPWIPAYSSTCNNILKATPTASCAKTTTPYDEAPFFDGSSTMVKQSFCAKSTNDNDPANQPPSASNLLGGDSLPWTWTCAGSPPNSYYFSTECSAPSQGKCPANNINKMFDVFEKTDATCDNGTVQTFRFDEDAYQWKWTCQGSAPAYDTTCSVNKTSTGGECNFIYDGKSFDALDTGQSLCTKGDLTNFTFVNTDIDSVYGWSWTCAGSIPSMNDTCSAHKTISKGICSPALINHPQDNLTGTSELCSQGIGTGIHVDETTLEWKRTCLGTRLKDNANCSTELKTTQGKCGVKNGQSCDTLTQQDALCDAGNVQSFGYNEATMQRSWYCQGKPATLSVQCSASKIVAGACAAVTGQYFYYNALTSQSLCSVGTPTINLPAVASSGVRNRGCAGPGNGGTTQCSAYQILDGKCVSLTGSVSVQPKKLCTYGHADNATIAEGKWIWTCEGVNEGVSMQCEIPCTNGICVNSDITQADGVSTPATVGGICYDPDGCMCGENRIFNGSTCSAIGPPLIITGGNGNGTNGDGTNGSDGTYSVCGDYISPLFQHTLATGFGGSVYGTSFVLPCTVEADLSLEHVALTTTGYRGKDVTFRIAYTNGSTKIATGAYVAYKFSPLLEDLTGSMIYTVDGEQTSTGERTLDILYFFLGNLQPGQTGEIIITGTLKKSLSGSVISNGAQIQSRLLDDNPLNNTKRASVSIEDAFFSQIPYLINPLIPLQSVIDKYSMIITWINADTVFRDIIPGYPRYMHIMTVQRNGIMQGYKYKYSTVFAPKKCISRGEYIMVMGRIMHTNGDMDDVYSSQLTTTPYKDVPTDNDLVVKYINRGHKRGLIDVFKEGKTNPDIMGIDKPVQHAEAKEILDKLYRMMQADTKVLKPLLVGNRNDATMWPGTGGTGATKVKPEDMCLTREETAYTITHILRGNPYIVMGFNDIFLEKLYGFLQPLSIKERRDMLSRLILKMKLLPPSALYRLGLDNETLIGVLTASMKGEEYKAVHDTSSVQNFFYEVSADQYDQYIQDLYK